MSETNVIPHDILVNGHTVSLFGQDDTRFPVDAANTDWILVKFDRFITYPISQRLRQEYGLEVHERVSDSNVYLCKYEPTDLSPIINDEIATHVAIYPNNVVPVRHLLSGSSQGTGLDTNIYNERASNGVDQGNNLPAGQSQDVFAGSSSQREDTLPLAIALHPNPSQTPQQVLDELSERLGAEHLDVEVTPDANIVRVRLARDKIQAAADIDSVRTIEQILPIEFHSIVADRILHTNTLRNDDITWTGAGEIVHVADSGFDKGNIKDVHRGFSDNRVLTVVAGSSGAATADTLGHGTHVAGSVLGDLPGGGNDMISMRGTAPEASLIAIALNFTDVPLDLYSRTIGRFGAPTIHTNSWGLSSTPAQQFPYGIVDARSVDAAMFNDSKICILFSAGNDGTTLIAGRQQQIGGYASAKNNIVVGSCYSTRPVDPNGKYDNAGTVHLTGDISPFSSRGPTLEQRLGVDVVAPGQVILSARSRNISAETLADSLNRFGTPGSDDFLFLSGTSMSTPAVTGCVACLRQAYRKIYGIVPSGAMLKALIIHGAVDLVGTTFANVVASTSTMLTMTKAPNTFQGYGLVNIANSLAPLVNSPDGPNGTLDGETSSGPAPVRSFTVPPDSQRLTVTLAYSDSAGAKLQNIITLRVLQGNSTQLPILEPTDPLQLTPKMEFSRENVAKVVVEKPKAGDYSIIVDVLTSYNTAKWAVVWSLS